MILQNLLLLRTFTHRVRPLLERLEMTMWLMTTLFVLGVVAIDGVRTMRTRRCILCRRLATLLHQAEEGEQSGSYCASFFFSRSFSWAGLALPPLSFITWPTKKPNSLSLPLR